MEPTQREETGVVTEAPSPGQRAVRIRIATGYLDLAPGEMIEINGEPMRILEVGAEGEASFLLHPGSKLMSLTRGENVQLKR